MTVYRKLLDRKSKEGKNLIALLDPDKKNNNTLRKQIEYINDNEFCAILIGGSLIMDSKYSKRIELIKENTNLPLISFPSSATQIDKNFDAILFLSLISGRNPQYLIGEHVISAPIIHDLKIETIPVGYILLNAGEKTAVELVSNTRSLPMKNYDFIVAHALASEYLGHQFIYLECGSNADKTIDLKLLSEIKKYVKIPIFVGGGIKSNSDIDSISKAGADFLVVGSMIEEKVALFN